MRRSPRLIVEASRSRLILIGLALLLASLGARRSFAQPPVSPAVMHADAELASVFFLDADRGWTVGDRGVIWHTTDGGHSWRQQNSNVSCRLDSVHFLDSEIGWAVGGFTQAYTHGTVGVVLRTRDGGQTWTAVPNLMLPRLRQVKFFDPKQGWALGDGSALYPSGVFRSDDGGRSWAPLSRGRTHGWVTGDFTSANSGAVAGRLGQLGLATQSGVNPSLPVDVSHRPLRRLKLTSETTGWLVGDGGLALTTADGGFTWSPPASPLPPTSGGCDFRALAVYQSHLWLAGSPGSRVFHSADAGQTWETQTTDQTLPLRDLTFVDENRGWAVGSLGVILVTRDGGKTWRRQQEGGSRLALLGVFSEPSRLPLELIALQAGNEGFLTGVELLGSPHRDLNTAAAASIGERAHEAVIDVGGSLADGAWRFPLPQPALAATTQSILDDWNRAANGQSATQLAEEHLVRKIRQWRPDVMVTEDVSPRGEDPLAHLTNQLVLAAVQKAADPAAYVEQTVDFDLKPWSVKKVFSVTGEKQGVVNITPSQWASRMGRSLDESAELGRSLLRRDVQVSAGNLGLSLMIDHLPQATGRRDVFSGMAILPGGEIRRQLAESPAADIQMLSRASQKRHNVQQLLSRIREDDPSAAAWLSQVNELTAGIGERASSELLFQMAQRCHRSGQGQVAAETLELLLERYPQSPLADASALWLVQYYASSEMALRQRQGTKYVVGVATAHAPLEAPSVAADDDETSVQQAISVESKFQSVGSSTTAAGGMNRGQRLGHVVALAKLIERTRPTLYAQPEVRFPLGVSLRGQGNAKGADRLFQQMVVAKDSDVWSQNAATEAWLQHPTKIQPKKILSCVTAPNKPRLDGRLDDTLWQLTHPISLIGKHTTENDWPATVTAAYDDQFLYLAISCRKAPGVDYSSSDQPRPRDADLSTTDRVDVLIDLDRDYSSYYTLSIDHRGWTRDSCFGDATWNPTWYVATNGDDQYWTAEAAIAWNQLTLKPPQAKEAWAIGLQRAAGHAGLQSFTQPAAAVPQPEGFGLMVFE